MKKILSIIIAILVVISIFSGCSSKDNSSLYEMGGSASTGATAEDSVSSDSEASNSGSGSSGLSGFLVLPQSGGELGEKMIYTAEIDMETKEFDATVENISGLAQQYGGFFESSYISGNSYGSQSTYRYANFTIRIPKENYEAALGGLQELGNVLYINSYSENITTQYTDTQSRLEAYRTEEERLLYMLDMAETVEDMLSIESRLSDVRYEIEYLTSSLMNMDNEVNYCTIDLYLNEVARLTDVPGTGRSYWQEIGDGIKNTFRSIGDFFKNLFKWFVVALPVLVILAAVAVIIILIIKKAAKNRRARFKVNEGETYTGFSDTAGSDDADSNKN